MTTSNMNLPLLHAEHICLSVLYTWSHLTFTIRPVLVTPLFCQERYWGSERLNHVEEVMQLASMGFNVGVWFLKSGFWLLSCTKNNTCFFFLTRDIYSFLLNQVGNIPTHCYLNHSPFDQGKDWNNNFSLRWRILSTDNFEDKICFSFPYHFFIFNLIQFTLSLK